MSEAKSRKKQVASRKRGRSMKTLDKYLIWAVLYIVGWSIAFFVAWIILRVEPGILEGCILAPGVVELVACAWIQQGKGVKNHDTETYQ